MANYKWTQSKIDRVSDLYRAGEPRRIIQKAVGCTAGVLAVQMSKMRVTRQPINNQKFAQLEAGYFNRKNTSLHTPIRL